MKKSSQKQQKSEESEVLPKFLDVESRVFTKVGQDIYIGRDKIDAQLRSVLRDEAINLQTTRLWEILNASVINESYLWALDLSEDFTLVQSAKMLKHWSFKMMEIINALAKKD